MDTQAARARKPDDPPLFPRDVMASIFATTVEQPFRFGLAINLKVMPPAKQ